MGTSNDSRLEKYAVETSPLFITKSPLQQQLQQQFAVMERT